jgi:hypothetical protein
MSYRAFQLATALIALVLVVIVPTSEERAKANEANPRVEDVEAKVVGALEHGLWGEETGTWRTKTQLVLDPATHQLVRMVFTIWDPAPSRSRDFTWVPKKSAGAEEIVSGYGRIVWRRRDLPSYDANSIVGVYLGEVENGRPSGQGEYNEIGEIAYAGGWVDGLPQGEGRLKLPNGDEYQGVFVAGRPHGDGRYVDAAGEIYQGTFVDGRREGRATTTLPSGATYQSEWHGGVEQPGSSYTRLAQAPGGSSPSLPSDDVQIRILVNAVSPRLFKSADFDAKEFADHALGYESSNADKRLEIRPANKRLVEMWKGNAEIQITPGEEEVDNILLPEVTYGVFSYSKTLLPPVDITVEVQNRATQGIQITGAYLDVAGSVTDKQPAVQISIGNDNYCIGVRYHSDYSPKINFENYGWGTVRNARIRYSFIDPASTTTPANLSQTRTIGDFDKIATVSFENDLKAQSVDTNKLSRLSKPCPANSRQACTEGFKCDPVNDKLDEQACLKQLGSGVFGSLADKVHISGLGQYGGDTQGNLVTAIAGRLEYDWTDAAGTVHNRTSPFREQLWLGKINLAPECGDGASVKRVSQSPLELKLDQSGYRVTVPIKTALPAGRSARYSMFLSAARASQHDFVVALQLADGRTIRSRPINLIYFYPAWFAEKKFQP